jgi:hypothetical protein
MLSILLYYCYWSRVSSSSKEGPYPYLHAEPPQLLEDGDVEGLIAGVEDAHVHAALVVPLELGVNGTTPAGTVTCKHVSGRTITRD